MRSEQEEKARVYMIEYNKRPEVRERQRLYRKKRREEPGYKERRKEYVRIYNQTTRAIAIRKAYQARPENIRKRRESWLINRYGLAIEVYESMFDNQGRVCAICKRPNWMGKEPHVDHDHNTGKIRGILCGGCNAAAGHIKNNPETARSMADYLEKNR